MQSDSLAQGWSIWSEMPGQFGAKCGGQLGAENPGAFELTTGRLANGVYECSLINELGKIVVVRKLVVLK